MLRQTLVWLDDQLSQEMRSRKDEPTIEPSEQPLYKESNFSVIYNTLKNLVAIINDGSFEESYGQSLDVLNACVTNEATLKEFFVNPDNWLLALMGNDPLYGFGYVVNTLLSDYAINVGHNFVKVVGVKGCPLHAAARFNLVRISKYLLANCVTKATDFQIPIGLIAASYNNLETARLDDFDANKRKCGLDECAKAAAYAIKYRNKNLYTYFAKRFDRYLPYNERDHMITTTCYYKSVLDHVVENPENLVWALHHNPPIVSLRILIKCTTKRSDLRAFFPAIRKKLITSDTLLADTIQRFWFFTLDDHTPSVVCELIDYLNEVPDMSTFVINGLSRLSAVNCEESLENIAVGLHFQSNAITKLRRLYTLFRQQLQAGGKPDEENILGRIVNAVISKPGQARSIWNVLTPDVLKEDAMVWGRRLFSWDKPSTVGSRQIMSVVDLSKQSTSSFTPADIVNQYCVILKYAFGKVISDRTLCIALISQVWGWPGEPENTPFELVQFARSACNVCGEKFMYDDPLWQSYHAFGLASCTNEWKEKRILFWMRSFNSTHMKSLERARFIQELEQTSYFLNCDFDVFVKNPIYFIDKRALWYLNNTLKGI